jgi:hypothetical protein
VLPLLPYPPFGLDPAPGPVPCSHLIFAVSSACRFCEVAVMIVMRERLSNCSDIRIANGNIEHTEKFVFWFVIAPAFSLRSFCFFRNCFVS